MLHSFLQFLLSLPLVTWSDALPAMKHKKEIMISAMRLVLSATQTFNFTLAKWLDHRLKPLANNKYTITDTFEWMKSIHCFPMMCLHYSPMYLLRNHTPMLTKLSWMIGSTTPITLILVSKTLSISWEGQQRNSFSCSMASYKNRLSRDKCTWNPQTLASCYTTRVMSMTDINAA